LSFEYLALRRRNPSYFTDVFSTKSFLLDCKQEPMHTDFLG
jgi:hypothetical protein